MSKGYTIQGGNSDKPIPSENEIGLTIYCHNCKQGRNFCIDSNLKVVEHRQMKSLYVISQCEKCKTEIEVRIGWVDRAVEKWTSKFNELFPLYQVKDDIGLGDMHE